MRRTRNKLVDALSPLKLFAQPIRLRFGAHHTNDPRCDHRLLIRKTNPRRQIVLLDVGRIIVVETEFYCPQCPGKPVFRDKDIARLVAPGANIGYDVMVYVGRATYQRHRTAVETIAELAARNVSIAPAEVGVLAKRFLAYLELAHQDHQEDIRSLLTKQGGYLLHLDGTCDGRSAHLLCAVDGLSELVLHSFKTTSENADEIAPHLEKLKQAYGEPLATITDMSKANLAVVPKIFPKRPHYICHFHFLRDIGKDLLGADYSQIRNRLKTHAISTLLHRHAREWKAQADADLSKHESFVAGLLDGSWLKPVPPDFSPPMARTMILWALAGKQQGGGYGFPFDVPLLDFYGRIEVLAEALVFFDDADAQSQKCLASKLSDKLRPVLQDPELTAAVQRLRDKKRVFDELREVMRIARPNAKLGLNDNGEHVDVATIENDLNQFLHRLRLRPDFSEAGPYGKMAAQIEEYWDMLLAAPIRVNTSGGAKIIYPNRTNNILENGFRDRNHSHRRKTGNNSMEGTLNATPAAASLIKNLDNPEFEAILLDGSPSLEDRFARIDPKRVHEALKRQRSEPGRMLPGIRRIFAIPLWPILMVKQWLKAKTG